ncbi:MAG: rhodanese-like domain-containing protein [Actinomycetota bacterium]
MPTDLDLDGLQSLLGRVGVQLIEVLPESEYAEEHLPGAINVPLKSMNQESVRELDRSAPTVVYCWDDA